MMDTSKYNFEKVNERSEDEVFVQEFYDKDNCVKYVRVTWDNSHIPEEMRGDVSSYLKDVLSHTIGWMNKFIPNCFKFDITDNSYEAMYFQDDDTVFMEKSELEPLLSRLTSDKLSKMTEDEVLEMSNQDVMLKVLDSIYESEEVVDLIKSIYKKYEGKEV